MYGALFVTFFLTAYVSSVFSETQVKPCKTAPVVPAVFEITGCPTPPCTAKKLTSMHAEITFTPDQDYEKLYSILEGMVMGVITGFPGVHGNDICGSIYTMPGKVKSSCPLKAGQEYLYVLDLPIEKHFLKITVNTRWGARDKKTKKDVFCGEIMLKIV
ncbi:NPC intracellular cholesterol transporter 2-like [Planococcus citri]|uniref:NPC intracellular cholesterol transporter 2-like n=1 Tax=Planococcus citri TaxID=170843 RepID=UPI0031F75F72